MEKIEVRKTPEQNLQGPRADSQRLFRWREGGPVPESVGGIAELKLGGRKCIVYIICYMQIRGLFDENASDVKYQVPCTVSVGHGEMWVED